MTLMKLPLLPAVAKCWHAILARAEAIDYMLRRIDALTRSLDVC